MKQQPTASVTVRRVHGTYIRLTCSRHCRLYFQIHLRTQLPIVCILVVVNDASKRGKEEGAFPRIVQTKRRRISSPIRIGNAILNPMFLYTPILKPFSAVKVWTLRISDTRTIVPVCVWVFQSFLETDNSCGITDTTAPPYSRIADALCPRKIIFILCDII